MSADAEPTPIPNNYLCRRCNYCGSTLRPDGLVDCQAAFEPVVPVVRYGYERFEDCPQRAGPTPLPPHKARLLAAYARRVTLRDGRDAMPIKVQNAEEVIRMDLLTTVRLRR